MIAVGVLVLLLATGVATIEEPQNDIREPDVKIMAFYVLNYGKNYYESDDKEAALNTLIQVSAQEDMSSRGALLLTWINFHPSTDK